MGVVATWLKGIGLSDAVQAFADAGIHTPSDLACLELDDFDCLGITDKDDRKKLFYLVQRIKMAVATAGGGGGGPAPTTAATNPTTTTMTTIASTTKGRRGDSKEGRKSPDSDRDGDDGTNGDSGHGGDDVVVRRTGRRRVVEEAGRGKDPLVAGADYAESVRSDEDEEEDEAEERRRRDRQRKRLSKKKRKESTTVTPVRSVNDDADFESDTSPPNNAPLRDEEGGGEEEVTADENASEPQCLSTSDQPDAQQDDWDYGESMKRLQQSTSSRSKTRRSQKINRPPSVDIGNGTTSGTKVRRRGFEDRAVEEDHSSPSHPEDLEDPRSGEECYSQNTFESEEDEGSSTRLGGEAEKEKEERKTRPSRNQRTARRSTRLARRSDTIYRGQEEEENGHSKGEEAEQKYSNDGPADGDDWSSVNDDAPPLLHAEQPPSRTHRPRPGSRSQTTRKEDACRRRSQRLKQKSVPDVPDASSSRLPDVRATRSGTNHEGSRMNILRMRSADEIDGVENNAHKINASRGGVLSGRGKDNKGGVAHRELGPGRRNRPRSASYGGEHNDIEIRPSSSCSVRSELTDASYLATEKGRGLNIEPANSHDFSEDARSVGSGSVASSTSRPATRHHSKIQHPSVSSSSRRATFGGGGGRSTSDKGLTKKRLSSIPSETLAPITPTHQDPPSLRGSFDDDDSDVLGQQSQVSTSRVSIGRGKSKRVAENKSKGRRVSEPPAPVNSRSTSAPKSANPDVNTRSSSTKRSSIGGRANSSNSRPRSSSRQSVGRSGTTGVPAPAAGNAHSPVAGARRKKAISPLRPSARMPSQKDNDHASSEVNDKESGNAQSTGVVFIHGQPTDDSWGTMVSELREEKLAKLIERHGYRDEPPEDDEEEGEEMRIRVVVRKRPMSRKERNSSEVDVIHPLEAYGRVLVYQPKVRVDLTKEVDTSTFAFDDVYDERSTNEGIYDRSVRHLIPGVFEGKWVSVFAYGQTGSGKTFTMMGSNLTGINAGNSTQNGDGENLGLYFLAARDVFDYASCREFRHLSVSASLFEIYGGKLFDLLNGRKQVKCLEDSKGKVCFPGLSEHGVSSPEQLMGVIEAGAANRSMGSTAANADSSRSHAVLQLSLRKSTGRKKNVEHGRLSFIDLAGSERGADTNTAGRATRLEGAEINTSLLALKEVIRALATGGTMQHIPFRGSKLTQVLKESFVGKNSRTVMITCVAPNMSNCEHTMNTLRYADRVKERNPEDGKAAVQPSNAGGTKAKKMRSSIEPSTRSRSATETTAKRSKERDLMTNDDDCYADDFFADSPVRECTNTYGDASRNTEEIRHKEELPFCSERGRLDAVELSDGELASEDSMFLYGHESDHSEPPEPPSPPTEEPMEPHSPPEVPQSEVDFAHTAELKKRQIIEAAKPLIASHKATMTGMLGMVKNEMMLVNCTDADRDNIDDYMKELEKLQEVKMNMIRSLRESLSSFVSERERIEKDFSSPVYSDMAHVTEDVMSDDTFEDLRD